MTLVELLKERYKDLRDFPTNEMGDYIITGSKLEQMLPLIQECDEFKHARLFQVQYPVFEYDKTVMTAKTCLLHDGTEFKGKCYLYTIQLSPEVFDPAKIYKNVKDNCVITPVMYNPEKFTPYKQIVINLDLGAMAEDMGVMYGANHYKKKLHEKLDDIIENPELYQIKGERRIMLRGHFHEIKASEKATTIIF